VVDLLPRELRRENSPEYCLSTGCKPDMSEPERQAEKLRIEAWRQARRDWAAANGFTPVQLFAAEYGLPWFRSTPE
jgi:hypothetical protein